MIVWLLLLLLAAPVAAQPQLLLSTSSDRDDKQESLYLATDGEGTPMGLVLERADGDREHFDLAQVAAGAVLRRERGNDILTIVCPEISPSDGGTVAVRYLYSAVPSPDYRHFTLELRRHQQEWRLFVPRTPRPLKAMHFLVNRVKLLGVVGIRDVVYRW